MENALTTIKLHDNFGNDFHASFRAIKERENATIGIATLNTDGEIFWIPAVVYRDGTVISARDWQAPVMDDEEIVERASDPTWAHQWLGPNGDAIVILNGLPRLFV